MKGQHLTSRTGAEKTLALAMQAKGISFQQNYLIDGYEADFWLAEHRLVIEVDGFTHLSDSRNRLDQEKDQYLTGKGITVLRITNEQIRANIKHCLAEVEGYIKQRRRYLDKGDGINDGWKEGLKKLVLKEKTSAGTQTNPK